LSPKTAGEVCVCPGGFFHGGPTTSARKQQRKIEQKERKEAKQKAATRGKNESATGNQMGSYEHAEEVHDGPLNYGEI